MNQHKNNKIHSQSKPVLTTGRQRITLDTSAAVPVRDQRPIARLYKLFSCFNAQYGKGAIKK